MTVKKTTPARKTPAPKPSEAPRPTNELGSMFVFTSGDVQVELPFVEHIPMGVLEDAVENATNVGKAIDHIISALTTEQAEARRALPLSEYGRLINEWNEASGTSLGELFG